MKKLLTLLAFLFFAGFSATGQNTKEDLNTWYNSLKSASNGTDKEIYMVKMLGLKNEAENSLLMDASLQIVSLEFAEEGNLKKATEYADKIKETQLKNDTEDYIAKNLISQNKYPEAHSILDDKVKLINKDEKNNRVPEKSQMMTALTYGELLFAEGNFSEATNYLHCSLQLTEYGEEYKENYLRAIIKGNSKNVNKELVSTLFLMKGKRSEAFKTDIKKWFVKTEGKDTSYLNLENEALQKEKNRVETMISKMAVNEVAPDFEVSDMNGNKVKLSSLKGKTVILDFWATWCQPCVSSFPGMQKAVNYYKNDSSVVFMFIHTAEKKGADPKKQAQALLKNKGYNLDVYFDLKDPATGKSPVAEKFKIKGIPAKFIINKQGIIKFSSTGYVSEDEAVDEIEMMIEKANSK